jgi:transcriptional regulator with GAF, ATPase, and Fis domain
MQYEEILKNIEQDEKNDHRMDLYRYNGLLEAIRYFANRLTLDQITDTAFDFVNELLTVDKSALYLFDGAAFSLKKERGVQAPKEIPLTESLSSFALYVGNVVRGKESLSHYFDASVIEPLDANVMLPLILEDKLYGFFLLSGRITAQFNESDILICETLMNLFNNAMESSQRLEKLQISNRELDEKIFNLFAINQSAKAMLTEHRLEELYSLAVDVFSELTQSAHTGFVLYDNPSEKYVLKSYRDVFNPSSKNVLSLELTDEALLKFHKQLLDLSNVEDLAYFNSLFPNGTEALTEIKALYAVMIYDKQKLLGFVTLGQTISGADYKKSAFELVDSLASYTYIALSNAMLIDLVNEQKALLQKKLDRLIMLNRLSKNINSAMDSGALLELALETLTVSFGVESAMITLYDEENDVLKICQSSDPTLVGSTLPITPALLPIKDGRTVFESNADMAPLLVGKEMASAIHNKAGVLALPMTLERYNTVFVGAILIFNLAEGILSDEENILTYETIANQVAPLINGFISLEQQKKLYVPDYAQVFIEALESQVKECLSYDFDLEVIRIKESNASPFCENGVAKILSELLDKVYPIAYDQTAVIVPQDFEYAANIVRGALADKNVTIQRLRLGRDFTDLTSFLSL